VHFLTRHNDRHGQMPSTTNITTFTISSPEKCCFFAISCVVWMVVNFIRDFGVVEQIFESFHYWHTPPPLGFVLFDVNSKTAITMPLLVRNSFQIVRQMSSENRQSAEASAPVRIRRAVIRTPAKMNNAAQVFSRRHSKITLVFSSADGTSIAHLYDVISTGEDRLWKFHYK